MEQPNVDSFEGLDLTKLPIDTVRFVVVVATRQCFDVDDIKQNHSYRSFFSVFKSSCFSSKLKIVFTN